jgi:cell division protein FtsB
MIIGAEAEKEQLGKRWWSFSPQLRSSIHSFSLLRLLMKFGFSSYRGKRNILEVLRQLQKVNLYQFGGQEMVARKKLIFERGKNS